MSAKDPRRAILIHLPPDLRRALKNSQARRGSRSLADTVRIELLDAPVAHGPATRGAVGRPLRLQLPKRQLDFWAAAARLQGLSPAELILASLLRKLADGGFAD